VTDLGVMIGHWLRHRRIVKWKLNFLVALLFSFGGGGFCGALLDLIYGPTCLLLAAVACLAAGAVFFAVMQHQNQGNESDEAVPRTSIFPDD